MVYEYVALFLAALHFGFPVSYYGYLKRHIDKPWALRINDVYRPSISVIVPTFDEALLIARRLENLKKQFYPMDKVEIVLVDSGSTDGTADIAEKWRLGNPDTRLNIVKQLVRKGKADALNTGLGHASGEVVVLTDADSMWDEKALQNAVKYLSDPSVGAVTGVKQPVNLSPHAGTTTEVVYRSLYNTVRVAESKIHSTPIFNGELSCFRRDLLGLVGGFPTDIGADDSHMAMLIALRGHRAICVPDAVAFELYPSSWKGYFAWKKRRGMHLIQHFSKLLSKLNRFPRGLRKLILAEAILHILDPWILVLSIAAFLASLANAEFSVVTWIILLLIVSVLIVKKSREAFRTWITEQLILVYAGLSGLISRELTWKKIEEIRKYDGSDMFGTGIP
jgi:cellulose synthase/poly-beta-1,6-N-acetylglucosamine synthase-like glycosyltransferase